MPEQQPSAEDAPGEGETLPALVPLDPSTPAPSYGETQRHLVCFPHAGAMPATYLAWFRGMDDRTALWGALRNNITPTAPPAERWEPVVRGVADAITQLPGTVLLYGHSMGSVLAYETAAELLARGHAVEHLVVSGREAPHTAQKRGNGWPTDPVALVHAVDAAYGGIPPEITENRELAQVFGADLQEDLVLHDAYTPRATPPLPVRLTALAGEHDPAADPAAVEEWQHYTSRQFACRTLPGGHMPPAEGRQRIAGLLRGDHP